MYPDPEAELVLYAVVSPVALKKTGGNRGKLGAQLGHAFMHAHWDAQDRHPQRALAYRQQPSAKKVVLLGGHDDQLRELVEAHRAICGVTTVVDAGFTVFAEPTFTAVGIGPLTRDERNSVLAGLPVLI